MDHSDENDVRARIIYYFRGKYYNLMLKACKEGISKFKGQSSFHLYNALALILNNHIEEGVHYLDTIRSENDIKLAVIIAIIYGNKLLGNNDKSLYAKLESEMREFRKTANAADYSYSAFVLWCFNKLERALDYTEKALNMQPDLDNGLITKGWILIEMYKSGKVTFLNSIELFQSCLNEKRNLNAMLGLVESLLFQNKKEEALDYINTAVVRHSSTHLPLIYKIKVTFAMQNWEQTLDTMNRILNMHSDDIDSIKINIIMLLCKDANYEEAVLLIKKLVQALQTVEPGNGVVLMENAQLFSRISGKNSLILAETFKMVEKAVQADSDNADYIVELAYQSVLQNKYRDALKYYKMASKIDNSSVSALVGLSLCELLENGNTEQLKKQNDFLLELEDSQSSGIFLLIQAKVATSSEEANKLLNKACENKIQNVKYLFYSDTYLRLLDPDYLLKVVKEYLQYASYSADVNVGSVVKPNQTINTALNVLQIITKACPCLLEALLILAKLQYITGDVVNASSNLEIILSKFEENSDAHLLMAQIHLHNGFYERAAQSLELGLSNDFKVRDNPLYHFIDGIVQKRIGNLPDAIKSFTTSLNSMNTINNSAETKKLKDNQLKISLAEKASLYIELIDAHNSVGQSEEAAKILETATLELRGSPEEARILILSADQYINRNNVQLAIDILSNVKPEESYYLQAKTRLADILLKFRRDRNAFLQCYKEMVEKNPGPDSYVLLGDAYLKILEPDDALECYNEALKFNPQDPYLTSKMGKALVETHYFAKAVNYYKETIKLTNNSDLKLQLADLYLQLKQYEQAETLLSNEIQADSDKNFDDFTYLQYKTKLFTLLATIQEKSGNVTGALNTLKEAKDNQNRARKRALVENSEASKEESQLLINICVRLAEISIFLKGQEQAINFYKEALDVMPNDTNILCALAKLYMQMNYLELCQKTCSNILRIDPDNETASVMMADIAFHKIDFDMAVFHFTQLVTKQPTNWTALVRLVEVLHRTGNIEDVPEYLKTAEEHCSNPNKEGGFLYCTALYQWYTGNLNNALRNFNLARTDSEWGQLAIYNMIEICLNPNGEMVDDQFIEVDDLEYLDSRSMALKTADRLLKELKQKLDSNGDEVLKYRLLVNFRLLATKDKFNVEKALDDFASLATQNAYKDHIGITLGIATAYTILKQSQRAKNQLKRIVKTPWSFEDAEYLEKCWLLLSDYYIQSQKFDIAQDLLNKVIEHNKSCSKAYEYLGFISEKEQHYKEAANYYDSAWKFGGKSNAAVGFKLAYSCMKTKRYADAIDIGQQVLKLNPDYPRIKKDILDKSMNNLRT